MAGLFFTFLKNRRITHTGTIVILNGPSASGKSSIQKQFQKINDELYLTIGIDGFFDQVLPDVDENGTSIKNNKIIRWVDFEIDGTEHQVIALHVGDLGHQVIQGMHRAIASYADQGNNVIVDYILYDQLWLPDLIKVFCKYKVYLIAVNAPLKVIEQRESKRGTSPIGHARSHFNSVHHNMVYDLQVETSVKTAEEIAYDIQTFITKNPEPSALMKLYKVL